MINRLLIACALAGLLLSAGAYASLFSATITVNGIKKHFAYNSISDLLNTITEEYLEKAFNVKREDVEHAYGSLIFRGLPFEFTYTKNPSMGFGMHNQGGDYTLTINIPDAGIINQIFHGNSMDQVQQEFKDWLTKDGSGAATKIFEAFVAKTAYDPVAGNPNSLMSSMVDNQYHLTDNTWRLAHQGPIENQGLFTLSPDYQHYTIDDNTISSISLPINYIRIFNKGNSEFIFSLPIAMTQTNTANTYNVESSIGFKQYITNHWALTPAISAGAVGSPDVGSVGLVLSGGLQSDWDLPMGHWDIGVHNLATYMKSRPVRIGEYNVDYKLENVGLVNGLSATYFLGQNDYAIKTSYSYTHFSGSNWYISNYSETSVELIQLGQHLGLTYSHLGIGLNYTFGEHNFKAMGAQFEWSF